MICRRQSGMGIKKEMFLRRSNGVVGGDNVDVVDVELTLMLLLKT